MQGRDGWRVSWEERATQGGRRSPRAVRVGPSVHAEAVHAATRDRPDERQWWGWRSCGCRARPEAAKTGDGVWGSGGHTCRGGISAARPPLILGIIGDPYSWRASASSLLGDASVGRPECVPQPGLQPGRAEAAPTGGALDPAWPSPEE